MGATESNKNAEDERHNMVKFSKTLVAALVATATAMPALAADYSGDVHKNDYKWMQFNLMRSQDARIPFGAQDSTYLEMEFGGRSGLFDLYGYVDFFDIFDSKGDDRHGQDNMFAKFAPRMSLDALTGKDLSVGPFKEFYLANVTNIGDKALFDTYWGVGSDVEMPWFGKMGLNAYARYVIENYGAGNEKKWDGYMVSTNWFKPVYNFSNNSFIAYQGYLDYKFGADKVNNDGLHSSDSMEWFHGIYWHNQRFAAGYGLKYFHNMALVKDGSAGGETSGFGHYFDVTYKF